MAADSASRMGGWRRRLGSRRGAPPDGARAAEAVQVDEEAGQAEGGWPPGEDQAVETGRSGASALTPIALVAAIAGGAIALALALLPLVGSAGLAVKLVDQKFLPEGTSPLILPAMPQRSTIHAADGSVLATVYLDYNRKLVQLDQVAPIARQAVLAAEDHSFYQHGPVDLTSIVRALVSNLRAGTIVQGGSTIAQQLVKNTETGDAQTLTRKIHEAQDAIRLERTYSKNQILDMYLNEVYVGNGVYGIGTAAQWYFNEPASQLNLAQSALLAGLISAPEYFNPVYYPQRAIVQRGIILQRMRTLGWITATQEARAAAAPLRLSTKGRTANLPGPQPYWVQFVVNDILHDPHFGKTYQQRMHALFQGGLQIYTTLQPKLQKEALAAIKGRMWGPGMPNSAVVSIVPQTGAIVAMVNGNQTWKQTQFDTAAQAGRTAGSAFKAFTLAAALMDGLSPNAVFSTKSPMTIPNCGGGATWTVNNAEGAGSGTASLAVATADSINVVFAQVINEIGPMQVAQVAHEMGITSPLTPVCPLTLGTSPVNPLEMTSGYSTIANGGVHCTPFAIAKVLSSTGQVVYRATPHCARAIPAWVASEETQLLQGVVAYGTGTGTQLPGYPTRPQAGKTGTGENYIDAWFMGFIHQLVTGVWVGYRQAEVPMFAVPGYGNGFGATLAGPIWHDYMAQAVQGLPIQQFPYVTPPPPKLVSVPNVVGKTQDAAMQILAQAKLSAIVRQAPSTMPAGTVFRQSPTAGASAPMGSGITIWVSNGKKPASVVPDVVGQPQGPATAAVQAAGFNVTVVLVPVSDPTQDHVVVAESPPGGTKAAPGSNVTLSVGQYAGPSPGPTPSPTATGATPARTADAALVAGAAAVLRRRRGGRGPSPAPGGRRRGRSPSPSRNP